VQASGSLGGGGGRERESALERMAKLSPAALKPEQRRDASPHCQERHRPPVRLPVGATERERDGAKARIPLRMRTRAQARR
jgi:hypothetical protein